MWNGATTGTNAPTVGYGVTSVQRNGTGDYTITFSTAFTSANYAVSGSANDTGSDQGILYTYGTPTTTVINVKAANAGGVLVDFTRISLIAFGTQ